MQFALLGPIGVGGGDGPLEINGTLRRTLLAALLLRPNQVVSADRLAELLWGDRPSVSATTSLYNQVMRLRQALGSHAGRIRAVPPGYVIDVEPGELDTAVFAEHCACAAQAARHGDWAASAREYAAAAALWRGDPLADVPALQSSAIIQQLREERILAVQGRIEAELHLGRHDQVIGELRTLTDRYPWREAFRGQLMLALYRAGRRSEGLEVYRELRRAVSDEFGVEPGDAVRALHDRILRSDPGLALPTPSTPSTPGTPSDAPPDSAQTADASATEAQRPVPLPTRASARQLPADTRTFTGREAELNALIDAARGVNGATPTVVISAIDGMGGIGKTALAVRAAHRLAEHYPDGQLFIDLHGHYADLQPVSSQEALDFLLRSIGVEPKAIPQAPAERAAFYRSRLAGTRTLILLDNARNPAQVRPLIPAEPGCLVIVTSRSPLTALDDADFLSLDALAPDDAVALLATTAGPGRVDHADPAAQALAEWCGRLPLAIRILGARLRHRPRLNPEALLANLRADSDPLALLREGDRDVTHVFASSLAVLDEPERRLFTRLALVPGPDFDAVAAAALQDTDVAEAERLLESLLDHSLLIQHEEGRYRLHDLLRAYARAQAAESEPDQMTKACDRLLDYYVETAATANALWHTGIPGSSGETRAAHGVETAAEAEAWFVAESENLLAAFDHEALDTRRKFELAASLAPYLRATGTWDPTYGVLVKMLELAQKINDAEGEADALANLATTHVEAGKHEDGVRFFERALALRRQSGDRLAEARALRALGWAFVSIDTSTALSYTRQAAEIFRELSPEEEASALHSMAGIANQNGRFEEAVEFAERLIERQRDAQNPTLRGYAFFHLSHSLYSLGRFDEIEPALAEALACIHRVRRSSAGVVQEFGRLRMLRGQFTAAAEYLKKALSEFIELGFSVGTSYAYGELARIDLRFGRPDAALAKLRTALRLALDSGQLYSESFVRTNLGYAHIAQGEFASAEEQLRRGLEASRRGGFLMCQAEARVALCALSYARDGAAAALPHYREGLAFVRASRHPREEAAALVGLGRCELETGDRKSGFGHLLEAIRLYERMGSALDVAETEKHLVPRPRAVEH